MSANGPRNVRQSSPDGNGKLGAKENSKISTVKLRRDPIAPQTSAAIVHALSVLSPPERQELAECEAVIERGWRTFVEVGQALTRIKSQKLYRAGFDTFEDYCREKWHYGRAHAYRLIGAAEVIRYLSPLGDIPAPAHEAQVRPLIGFEPEKAREIWRKAAERAHGAMITARLVRDATREVVNFEITCKNGAKE